MPYIHEADSYRHSRMTKELQRALCDLWEAAEEWAETESMRENTPQEQRVVDALRALRRVPDKRIGYVP